MIGVDTMFSTIPENTSINETTYEDISRHFHEKDGFKHVIILNGFSNLANLYFECDLEFSLQLDKFLSHMQNDGYELVDIKVTPIANPNIVGFAAAYNTMIIYR
ncbi:MAG: hypothetical protein RR624_07235 [Longicatena sp.]